MCICLFVHLFLHSSPIIDLQSKLSLDSTVFRGVDRNCLSSCLRSCIRSFIHLSPIIYWSLWLYNTTVLCVWVNQQHIIKERNNKRDYWPIHCSLVIDSFYCYRKIIPSIVIVKMIPYIVMVIWYYGSTTTSTSTKDAQRKVHLKVLTLNILWY